MGRSVLELRTERSHPDLLLLAPARSPPGGPAVVTGDIRGYQGILGHPHLPGTSTADWGACGRSPRRYLDTVTLELYTNLREAKTEISQSGEGSFEAIIDILNHEECSVTMFPDRGGAEH